MADYLDEPLTFYADRIEVTSSGEQVMMTWEAPLMDKMAEIACLRRGDVLEIGFGMGISCDAVQRRPHKSHTIVEAHPQIVERARAWAALHPSAHIVAGRFQDVLADLGTFDGISFDVYGGVGQREAFLRALPRLLRPGGVATLWLADDRQLRPELAAILAELGYAHRLVRVSAVPDKRCTYSRTNEFTLPIISRAASPAQG